MTESDLELADGTLRQRRNLILFTTAQVFVHLADVEFGNEINFLGSVLHIGNPGAIPLFLGLFQAYFLWRFYQYFHTDKAYGALRTQLRSEISAAREKKYTAMLMDRIPEKSIHSGSSLGNAKPNEQGLYIAKVKVPLNGTSQTETRKIEVPARPITMQRVYVSLLYIFRGKILSDYFLPYAWVLFSLWLAI